MYTNTIKEIAATLPTHDRIVIICVGSMRVTGDSYGPRVGSILQQITSYPVIGTMEDPCHATNMLEKLEILKEYKDHFVIAIDAALTNGDRVGELQIDVGGMKFGHAVGLDFPTVGDLSVKGVVDKQDDEGGIVLFSTPIHRVHQMARLTAKILCGAFSHRK